MQKKHVLLTIILVILLLFSIFLNCILFKKSIDLYAKEQEVLLEPIHTSKNIYKESNTVMSSESILMIGDSRIAMWFPKPDMNAEIINYGIGGETTIQLYYRVKRESDTYKNNIIIVQTGVNDLKAIGLFPDREDEISTACFENIKATVSMLSNNNRKVFLLTIFPHGKISLIRKPVWDEAITEAIHRVNTKLLNLKLPNVYIINCDSVLLGKKNLLNPLFRGDDLHLNEKGYKKLNFYLEPKINNYIKLVN